MIGLKNLKNMDFETNWQIAKKKIEKDITKDAIKYLSEAKLSVKATMSILQGHVDLLISLISHLKFIDARYFNYMEEQLSYFRRLGFVSSKYKLFKYLEDEDLYFAPDSVLFKETGKVIHHTGEGLEFDSSTSYMRTTKIQKVYSALFNRTNFLLDIIHRLEEIKKEEIHDGPHVITNMIQGSIWKDFMSKMSEEEKEGTLFLPYILNYDDVQLLNQMSAHCQDHKVGLVFGKIGVLPKSLKSKLEAVQLLGDFYAKHIKELSVEDVFEKIIKNLRELAQGGIDILSEEVFYENKKIKKVKLVTIVFCGDMLGVSIANNFVSSFSALYCCLKCYIHRDERPGKGPLKVFMIFSKFFKEKLSSQKVRLLVKLWKIMKEY